jgi:cytochrome c oxidase subunit 2
MVPEESLAIGRFRLLEVDNRVCLPINVTVRILVLSKDVLHCFSVPSCGIKIDACPGRLNQVALVLDRPGVFFGNCNELCGTLHHAMPVVIQGVSLEDFSKWLLLKSM